MNAYFNLHRYGSPHQEPIRSDPMIFDPPLTSTGRALAREAGAQIRNLTPRPEILLVSPLRRCMETVQIALADSGVDCEVFAEPLLREKLTLSSDVGSLKSDLMKDFPSISFPSDSLEGMDQVWWFKGAGNSHSSSRIDKEPSDVYEARMEVLRSRLRSRKESSILVVSHWGVLNSLAGLDLSPAQLSTFTLVL